MTQSTLHTRAWKLYNYLKDLPKGAWATQRDIYNNVGGYEWHDRKNDCCCSIWTDIEIINSSPETHYIIVVKKYKYKIATEEEAKKYRDNLKYKALRKLKRAWLIDEKMSHDKQGVLIDSRNQVITAESKAKRFIETFMEE